MMVKKKESIISEEDVREHFREELGHADIKDVDKFIPTGSTLLDYAIANRPNGGIPVGKIIEICGNEATGKSLLAYHIIANAQKLGGLAVYIDTERSANKQFMQRMGIDFNSLITPKSIPSTIEEVFDYIEKVVKVTKLKFPNKDKPVVVVWDSVAATMPKEEAETDQTEDGRIGPAARAMSKCLRKSMPIFDEGFVTIVCVNQLRTKIGISFGDPDITPHGKSLAFYASVRIKLKALKQIKDSSAQRTVGVQSEARVFKNKIGPGHRKTLFPIMYDWGVEDFKSIQDYLIDCGIITGTTVKTITIEGKEYKFKNADWESLLQKEKEVSKFVTDKLNETLVIKFDQKPDLDIDVDSILEIQQVKDDMEEL